MLDLLGSIVLIFAGGFVTWIIQQYQSTRSIDIALINEHIVDIERLSESAQAYWLKAPADPTVELELSGRVRAAHAATTLLYGQMVELCASQSSVEYTERYAELFTVATGGSFETLGRAANPLRAIQVADISARIVHILRLERGNVVSVSRAFSMFGHRCREIVFTPESRKPWLRYGTTH